jgi:FKBP-type peptidyl-prolyl cis-trans isomerase FkpA
MKQLFVLSSVLLFFLASCKKNTTPSCPYTASTIVAPAAEQEALHDSLTAHGLTGTLAPSGFYYTINDQGDGPSPTGLCSTVAVFYRGGFFNGKGFDSSATGAPAIFQLGQVIPGWQKALPLIAKSGDMAMYIPPSLAYGSKPVINPDNPLDTVIPANSYLVFHVVMADVQ